MDEDGTVSLLASGGDKALIVVAYDVFLESYQIVRSVPVAVLEDWVSKRPLRQAPFQDVMAKAYVQIALAGLASELPVPKVRIQLKPTRAVFMEASCGIGKLVLWPDTNKIMLLSSSKQAPPGSLACTMPPELCANIAYLVLAFSESFAVPAWALRRTEDEQQANVRVITKNTSVVVTQGKISKAVDIGIPVMTNYKILKKDDELMLYQAPAPRMKGTKRTFLAPDLVHEKKHKE